MLTLKQETVLIDRIKSLSELELDSLLKEIGQHLRKNNLEHLIDNSFDIETFEDELREAEDRIEELEDYQSKLEDINRIADDLKDTDELQEDAYEVLIEGIKEITDLSNI